MLTIERDFFRRKTFACTAIFVTETSFDWTILSGADTTENNDCNRSPRIRSIGVLVTPRTSTAKVQGSNACLAKKF